MWRRSRIVRLSWICATLLLAACGGDNGTGPDGSGDDPAIAPFVGDWSATSLVLTNVANPSVAPDLIDIGATFDLNIQPSGQYTATLVYLSQPAIELGKITVSGATVTFNRSFPSASTDASSFVFNGPDQLTLDGPSEFDFNLDGTPEPAIAHIEFVRK